MEFRLSGSTVLATGPIVAGDATRFRRFVAQNRLAEGFDDVTVQLNSPGGALLEGIALGVAIQEARIITRVARGDECSSACALAFLGGTRRYATAIGPSRQIEFGAMLGFHGFRMATSTIRLENDTISTSRVLTALILEYASRMGGIDLGWLARSLNVPPDRLQIVRRPSDIAALGITLEGLPRTIPEAWHHNACRWVVAGLVPILDGWGNRVGSGAAVLPTVRALRDVIVGGRFPSGPIAEFAATLPDDQAIDLALGSSFNLAMRRPILDARIVPLERGAGFYFDRCVAIRSNSIISILLIDDIGNRIYRQDFSESTRVSFQLAMRDREAPLW
jgi:hypothetical protein